MPHILLLLHLITPLLTLCCCLLMVTANCFLQFLEFFTSQTHDALIDLLGLLNYVACIFTQPGPDLVKVMNLETSGPGLTIPDTRLGLASHSKQGFTLAAANPSHWCSLSNYPMQWCCEIRLKFVATRIISNSPIFQPHSSPLCHAHTHQQAANIWGYLLCVILTPTFSCQHVTT